MDFPAGIPNLRRKKSAVIGAILVMVFELLLWFVAVSALLIAPIIAICQNEAAIWTAVHVTLSATFLGFVVYELWAYPRLFVREYSAEGHARFGRLWPFWRRYVIPAHGYGFMPRVNIVGFTLGIAIFGVTQFSARDWDLRTMTSKWQECREVSRYKAPGSFRTGLKLLCADGKWYMHYDRRLTSLVTNPSPISIHCETYQRGVLTCSR